MEPAVTMMNGGEWSSFNGGGWCEGEEADFMAQFFSSCLFPSEVPDEGFLHGHEYMMAGARVDHGGSFFSSESNNSEHSKENSYSTDTFSAPNHPCTMLPENYCLTDPNNQYLAADDTSSTMLPIDLFTLINAREGNGGDRAQAFPTGTRMEEPEACQLTDEIENTAADKQQHLQINSSYSHMRADLDLSVEDRNNSNSSKKRQRTSHDHVSKQKEKKYAKSRKNQKTGSTCDRNKEEDDGAPPPLDGQSSGSCSSEDDDFSGCHQDMNGGSSQSQENNSSNSTISTKRASRGSATDPQSLYARRRRERINERLRILQNLVPNGTKVDISTMLEEAAQYVKFLQLQIKMLSSDDLWMYSPIAYNGLDLNLNNLAN